MKPGNIIFVIALAVLAGVFPKPADATVTVCNKGNQSLWVAAVANTGEHRNIVTAGGWYHVKTGDCRSVVPVLLSYSYLSFMTLDVNKIPISIHWRPAKRRSEIKTSNEKFCVHPTNKFNRRGSLPFLAQCPKGFKLALFSAIVRKGTCQDSRLMTVPDYKCSFSVTLHVAPSRSSPGLAFTAGPPIDHATESKRQEQAQRDRKALLDIAKGAIGKLLEGTSVDPARDIIKSPLGHVRTTPAAQMSERAYRACRKRLTWKSTSREEQVCQCISKNVRYDKYTEPQMQKAEKNFMDSYDFGSVREKVANKNAFDICFARNATRR